MKIRDVIFPVTDIVLYYYSLIHKFKITENLRLNVSRTIIDMWENYLCDISYDNIDSIDVLEGIHSKRYDNLNIDMFDEITYEIISYIDNGGLLLPNMSILSINDVPFSGITLTHEIISNIIEFYLN